jgi:hypothetical protein
VFKKAFVFLWILAVSLIGTAQKNLVENISNEDIKTVLLYPYGPNQDFAKRYLNPPVLNMASNQSLFLEFDDLRANYTQYRVKIIHCEIDGTQSNISEMDYLKEFNEFIINNYQVSRNTKVQYYHYIFKLPNLYRSGLYKIAVFEEYTSGTPVIEKYFEILDAKVKINASINPAQDPQKWQTDHQINLKLDFGTYTIYNPQEELLVYVKQNFRNDRIFELNNKRLFAAGNNVLSYRFFENENLIPAGNEFRYCDVSSNFSKGDNVSEIKRGETDKLRLIPQRPRNNKAYLNAYDNDGGFIINNYDNQEYELGSDYMEVSFVADQPRLDENEKISVVGKFNNWDKNDGQMSINPNTGFYEKTYLLKQGIYDFEFELQNSTSATNPNQFEGDFSETNNSYEIFIYHKSPRARSTELIGYQRLNSFSNK